MAVLQLVPAVAPVFGGGLTPAQVLLLRLRLMFMCWGVCADSCCVAGYFACDCKLLLICSSILLTRCIPLFGCAAPPAQVLLQSTPTHSGAMYTSAVAAGGRYDALLRSLWSPAAATLMPPPGAVGVSINCEKIVKMLLQKRRHKAGAAHGHGSAAAGFGGLGLEGGGRLPAGQCDVLVCARGDDGMLQVRRQCMRARGR